MTWMDYNTISRWWKSSTHKNAKPVRSSNWALLGYGLDEQKEWVIIEEEAVVVRTIYSLYLEGYSSSQIAEFLTKSGIPTVKGLPNRSSGSVLAILKNEKYCGDALCQKTVTVDFFTHKSVKNNGLETQYFMGNPYIRERLLFPADELRYYSDMRDVLKYYLPTNTHFENQQVCVSEETWAKLSENQRTILSEEALKMCESRWVEAEQSQKDHEKLLAENGVEVIELSDEFYKECEKAVVANTWEKLSGDLGEELYGLVLKNFGERFGMA